MNDWTEDNGKTYCKREKESARVRYCNAWSFNLSEHDINQYTLLRYYSEIGQYEILVEDAKKVGLPPREISSGEVKLNIPIEKNWLFIKKENKWTEQDTKN